MESTSLEGVCERLRQEVAAELVTGPGKSWRCRAGLKSRIVSYARACRKRGEPSVEIFVHGQSVDPLQWLDDKWVQEKIMAKLESSS